MIDQEPLIWLNHLMGLTKHWIKKNIYFPSNVNVDKRKMKGIRDNKQLSRN